MVRSFLPFVRRVALAVCLLTSAVHAQCLDWRAFPHTDPVPGGVVQTIAVCDGGSGPALYLGGGGLYLSNPSQPTNLIKWDGTHFTATGPYVPAQVTAILS